MGNSADKPPGFSLAHLLLWTACCGAYLAVVRQIADAKPGVVGMLLATLGAMIDGTALAGLAVFITRRVRGVRWVIEPGEWLLAILGSRLLVNVALRTVLAHVFESPRAVGSAVMCVLLVMPMLSRRLPTLWKAFFGLLAVWYSIAVVNACLNVWLKIHMPLLNSAAHFTQQTQHVVAAVLICVFVLLDKHTNAQRGWLHWLGIGTCLAMLCVPKILQNIL